MRTTLNLDDDVLAAVKERAKHEQRSYGAILSDLARQTLSAGTSRGPRTIRNGFVQRHGNGKLVTNETIDQLRDELGI